MSTLEADMERFTELMRRTNVPDPAEADMAELAELFDRRPGWPLVLHNPYDQALNSLIAHATEGSGFCGAVLKQHHAAFLRKLGYDEATALERLLIETAGLAWLHYTEMERQYQDILSQEHIVEVQEYWEPRISVAQKRYLRAIETLARVRSFGSLAGEGTVAEG